jgi:uncharacterized membrane protein
MDPPRVCPFSRPSIHDFTTGVENSMPIWYHDQKHYLHKVSEDTTKFLTDDLDVSRLDRIQKHFIGLRLAGRYKAVARPLHRQLMMDRQIIVTEQADLHLTWDHAGIYIKPLPAYLFDQRIWDTYLCRSSSLYKSACGLLLSYVWLITHEGDFRLAVGHEIPLLPFSETLTWTIWRKLVEDLSCTINVDTREAVSPRYMYGELRLDRLNTIYRFSPVILSSQDHALIRGYHYRYHRYSSFFEQNFSWLIVVFAYVTIVLSAMQVGLASTRLGSSPGFQHAAYGFAVFAIVVPVTLVGDVIALFMLLFISNILATLRNWLRHTKSPRSSQPASTG